MKQLRRFLVKHFALYYRVKIIGTWFNALRCTRIMMPYFLLMACITVFDPAYPLWQWWDTVIAVPFAFMLWLSFPWFGFGYFERWPIKREELDEEQKKFFDQYQKLK